MRYTLLASGLFFIYTASYSQSLVANGGFEDENICTEYQKNCSPEAWIATSLWSDYYFYEKQFAEAGSHFVGLAAGNTYKPGIRNFIRSRLLCGLRKGHQYRLEFYIRSLHTILDSIGVYFSSGDFLFETKNFKDIQPQLWTVNGLDSPGKDPSEWQKVHFIYTAMGEEGFITIGNFKRVDYTGIKNGDYKKDYYFFLDEISFVPVDEREKLCIEADSVRKVIYDDNARHDYVRQRRQFRSRIPEELWPLPKTQMPGIQQIDTLVVPDIFFTTKSYELSPESAGSLDSFANKLGASLIDSVIIEGHTDSVGKLEYNRKLSLNRAESIKEYLSGKIPSLQEKIIIRGYAFLKPVSSNKTPEGRQQNRRVEIFVYKKE